MSYRSTDGHRFDALSKQITELKKEVNKREQEKKEMADVIEQDSLVEIKGTFSSYEHYEQIPNLHSSDARKETFTPA